MTDKPYLKKLRELTRADPGIEHLEEIENELYARDNDRATAVMFGSFVETSLLRLIQTVMRDDLNSKDRRLLFGYEGSFGTFSSKIVTAYALRLIGPISRSDLDIIRYLRNEFAHSRMSFGFSTPEIKSCCDELQLPDQPQTFIPLRYQELATDDQLPATIDKNHPKTRFICTCHTLAQRMFEARNYPQNGSVAYPNDEPLP